MSNPDDVPLPLIIACVVAGVYYLLAICWVPKKQEDKREFGFLFMVSIFILFLITKSIAEYFLY